MSDIVTITGGNFSSEVLESGEPVMIDFWAPWCGPCKMVGPIVEALAGENSDKIKVGKVNVDDNRDLAVQYGIQSIPTLIFFKNGMEAKRIIGAQGKAQMQRVIDEIVG